MLTAYYDLETSPPTYDFVAFLLAAERYRLERKEECMTIEFIPGRANGFRPDKLWPQDPAVRQKLLERICIPMATMLPSVTDIKVHKIRPDQREPNSLGWMCRLYGLRLQVECMRAGIRPLRAAVRGLDYNYITITLREAEHWPQRNSNLAEWQKAAAEIRNLGYTVIIIRDEAKAEDPFPGFQIAEDESRDLLLRAALYRDAACNLFVSNGPAWMALGMDAPVLMLKPVTENLMGTCSASYFQKCGIPFAGQIPGSPKWQRLVWAEDGAVAIVAAFVQYMDSLVETTPHGM